MIVICLSIVNCIGGIYNSFLDTPYLHVCVLFRRPQRSHLLQLAILCMLSQWKWRRQHRRTRHKMLDRHHTNVECRCSRPPSMVPMCSQVHRPIVGQCLIPSNLDLRGQWWVMDSWRAELVRPEPCMVSLVASMRVAFRSYRRVTVALADSQSLDRFDTCLTLTAHCLSFAVTFVAYSSFLSCPVWCLGLAE